ncbi:MAG: GldG family protein [Verrucomicrobia bacterium]|nr:GldG family protein [Verrucomicrobiota bacterium]
MNKKSIFSTLLIVTAILLVVNHLVGGIGIANLRFDLTEKKLYTLSDGTKHILTGLDKPVSIRFYATSDSRLMPQWVQSYATTVEDLLLEFEKAANGKLTLERIDPRPDSESEDKARADDIAGHVVNAEEDKVYFGLAVQSLDKKEVIPALSPNDESGLEYLLARAIAKVTKPKKSVIGVITPLPIASPAMSQQMMMMMQKQQQPPWAVFTQLRMDYEVREVPVTTDKIDADINILLVVHPADLPPQAEFAIDQFVLRGGKVVAFVDPQCAITQNYSSQGNPMTGQPPSSTNPSSNLKDLFKAWGIGYDPGQVVADMNLRTPWQRGPLPTFLTITHDFINQNEQVTAPLEVVQMFSPGSFSIEKKDGIKTTVLLESSENQMLIDGATAERARREPLNNFQPAGRRLILGLRLSGKFKTAFPDGPPKVVEPPKGPAHPGGFPGGFPGGLPGGTGGSQDDVGSPKPSEKIEAQATTAPVTVTSEPQPVAAPASATTTAPVVAPKPAEPSPAAVSPVNPAAGKKEEPKANYLKESVNDQGMVFLFSDADMLFDGFCFQQDQLGRLALVNHNVPLLLNIVEQLNGGADLINVRSRGSTKRGFTKLQEIKDAVEKEYRPKIEQLDHKLNETVQKISSLKVTTDKQGNQSIILGPKEKKDLDELMATQASISKELRNIKKEQNKGKDLLETWIIALNLVAVPLLVIAFGVALALRRRSLQAAK